MPISELAASLAANQMHVVVFGPGYGESIAVHIPDAGWLVCDSLTGSGNAAGFVPAVELISQRGERATMAVLTHPHDDHVGGFDRVVTRLASGPVGVVGFHLAPPNFTESDNTVEVLSTSNRLKALAAIRAYWRQYPEFEWRLVADGTTRPIGSATVEVLHPDLAYLNQGSPDPAKAPNAYSTPLLIEWEGVRIVLGADLPTAEWDAILAAGRGSELAAHAALKVSHHGSMTSWADRLVTSHDRTVPAVLTPWHKGRGLLPKLHAKGGVAWLLKRRNTVSLSSTGRALIRRLPQPVDLPTLAKSVEVRPVPGAGSKIEVKRAYDPDESWVAVSFRRSGELASVTYGRESRAVVV